MRPQPALARAVSWRRVVAHPTNNPQYGSASSPVQPEYTTLRPARAESHVTYGAPRSAAAAPQCMVRGSRASRGRGAGAEGWDGQDAALRRRGGEYQRRGHRRIGEDRYEQLTSVGQAGSARGGVQPGWGGDEERMERRTAADSSDRRRAMCTTGWRHVVSDGRRISLRITGCPPDGTRRGGERPGICES